MKTISVINYKGGVGKTTLTANIGVQLAKEGLRVLMVDLDPQTSLTFSFIPQDAWKEYAANKTIKNWFDAYLARESSNFSDLLLELPKIKPHIGKGKLQLISSHLELIHIDMDLAQKLGGGGDTDRQLNYLEIFTLIKKGLNQLQEEFDIVLIDCPPNFNVVTRTAIAASDHILTPTKADYLSTIGFESLLRNVSKFKTEFNDMRSKWPKKADPIAPAWLGVIFTMVSLRKGEPIRAQKGYVQTLIELVPRAPTEGGVGSDIIFEEFIRENKTEHASAPEDGIPVVLGSRSGATYEDVRAEFRDLAKAIRERLAL